MSASAPIHEVIAVMGMCLASPPIFRMSCSWCIPMITDPAARNSSALKKACVMRWKMAPLYAETPSATVMYPSCESVEYATTRLMSLLTMPSSPMKNAVVAPMINTNDSAVSEYSKIGDMRATMKMPAVTMVAAWISAEIGVGPSIESGSHTCSGTCALLPIAPMNRQMQITVISIQSLPGKPIFASSGALAKASP